MCNRIIIFREFRDSALRFEKIIRRQKFINCFEFEFGELALSPLARDIVNALSRLHYNVTVNRIMSSMVVRDVHIFVVMYGQRDASDTIVNIQFFRVSALVS